MRPGAVFHQMPGGWTERKFLPWIIACDFREHRTQRGGEVDQRIVLLGSKIILFKHLALHDPFNDFRPGGPPNEILRADSTIPEFGWNLDGDLAARVCFVPLV